MANNVVVSGSLHSLRSSWVVRRAAPSLLRRGSGRRQRSGGGQRCPPCPARPDAPSSTPRSGMGRVRSGIGRPPPSHCRRGRTFFSRSSAARPSPRRGRALSPGDGGGAVGADDHWAVATAWRGFRRVGSDETEFFVFSPFCVKKLRLDP